MNMSNEAQTAGAEPTPPTDEPAAQELQRVNRILRTLSAGNRCLLRAGDERALLQDMCRVIVEEGTYRMAWVGYAQRDPDKTLTPMAHAGFATGYFEDTSFSWADDERGRGASGSAVRTGKRVVGRNILTNPGSAPWREQALKCGYAAISAFPLIVEGEVIGNLTILAAEPDAFDAWEVRLLAELAEDLAYGIANLRTRAKQQEAQATIARMAHYDALTSLPNRTLLRERVLEAISAAREEHRSLALLLLSVERFDEINDTLGYAQGDQLLLEIVRRVQAVSRENELLARVGEADFALLLPSGSAEIATQVAQQIVHTLYEPVELPGAVRADGRANVGIALFPGHGTDPDALVRRATMAMRQAKQAASGYAIYAGSLDRDSTRRLALMGDLHRAIANHELLLFCQPKVRIASRQVCGAEALVRWQHPEFGMLSTGEFVKLAEHAGLITPLTHWVLDAACSQRYRWHEAGLNEPLSINLSAHDLRDPRLLDRIKGLFSTWGTQPNWIEFELTESALMEDPQGTLATLTQLKQLGAKLFIDDFGTGYSSLSYLQKLPVDAIKIDQSFVMPMTENKDSEVIVRSTIELGHNLKLEVVAEGIESEAIWTRLEELGCDTAQGYFISRPIPADTFGEWKDGFESAAHHPS
jgi:diguanylate cyclase (GGDEF)-like protein